MSPVLTADQAPWLSDPVLQRLLAVLSTSGEEARVVGGAIRNSLLGEPVTDIDIATTTLPQETARRGEAAGFKAVPTGADHGTITLIAKGRPYEVTTLRADVETDGRHAKVAFGRDWKADAERRDFTINALYARADGTIVDLVGGIADIESRTVRFIGDAALRIEEDRLRILRFFRFFAWYGKGRPDADGLRACARLKADMAELSAERVWAELKKLLAARDPGRALLWMRQASVLSTILPESEKWGIDAIPALIEAEGARGWTPDPLLRLMAMMPPRPEVAAGLAKRLKLSRVERDRLERWATAEPARTDVAPEAMARMLYRSDIQSIIDRYTLLSASSDEGDMAAQRLEQALTWTRPDFPISAADLIALGLQPGPELGAELRRLETYWVDSGFSIGRDTLLRQATTQGH